MFFRSANTSAHQPEPRVREERSGLYAPGQLSRTAVKCPVAKIDLQLRRRHDCAEPS